GCPADGKATAGTACGSSDATYCNAPDTCDGTGACVDRLKPASTLCRAAGASAACDPAEYCTGSSPACPMNAVAQAGTPCGASAACPGDVVAPSGTACGSSDATACNAPDSCDSAGNCVNRVKVAGTVCRAAGASAVCNPAEVCDGASTTCPNDVIAGGGTAC